MGRHCSYGKGLISHIPAIGRDDGVVSLGLEVNAYPSYYPSSLRSMEANYVKIL